MRRKYNMLSPEEKEIVVKRYFAGETITKIVNEKNIGKRQVYYWIEKHQKEGIDGLKSQTGKKSCKNPHAGLSLRKPKSKIEELELEILKKDIEIARLKKGYQVKGVGPIKEYDTTFEENMK